MTFRAVVVAFFLAVAVLLALRAGFGRDLLGLTVRACVLDHDLLNAATPCLVVDTVKGQDKGYAILRAPTDESHFILTPTKMIIGIEAPELRRPGTPNYVAMAWAHRHLAYPNGRALPDDDMALAVNSQRGRTQDQLHVHVDCLLPMVRQRLSVAEASLRAGKWTPVQLDDGVPYWTTPLSDLGEANVVDLAATFLKLSDREMPQLTLAISAVQGNGPARFVLAARRDKFKQHAELLLDHDCESDRRWSGRRRRDATPVRQPSGVAPAADRPSASPKSG